MILIKDENELLETFRDFERAEVQVPAGLKFPLVLRDHLSWPEPSGHRTYLVVHDPNRKQPYGIVFKRSSGTTEMPAMMCEWCHSVRAGNSIDLLTATVTPRRRIGAYLCRSLDCRERLKETPHVSDIRESLPADQKLARIQERMLDFANQHLF